MPSGNLVLIQRLAVGNVVVALAVLGLKYAAFRITGSVALYSDALESIVNVLTAVMALAVVRFSAMPADSNHPYGHTKAEYFSVVVEGVLIIVAAVAVFREAWLDFADPKPLQQPGIGLALNAGAAFVNAVWCYMLIREGRRNRSPALVADGRHLLTDVVTSVGVIVGLLLALATGWLILDPLLAALVAANILWSGWSLLRESVSGLMDEAVPAAVLDTIRGVISGNATGAIEAHDLRTRRAGRITFVDFHLVVPGTMSVSEAHAICDDIERALKAAVADLLITIHVEPEEKAKHHGVLVL